MLCARLPRPTTCLEVQSALLLLPAPQFRFQELAVPWLNQRPDRLLPGMGCAGQQTLHTGQQPTCNQAAVGRKRASGSCRCIKESKPTVHARQPGERMPTIARMINLMRSRCRRLLLVRRHDVVPLVHLLASRQVTQGHLNPARSRRAACACRTCASLCACQQNRDLHHLPISSSLSKTS